MLCGVMRRFDEAAEWFAKSRVIVEEQGSRPVLARLDFHEARMYARRGAAGDGQRAAGLLRSALEQFREIGMSGFARRAEDMLAHAEAAAPAGNLARTDRLASKEQVPEALALGVTTPTGGTPSAESGTRIFRREGDYWTIVFDGKVSRLKDARGLHYVAQLLRRPGVKLAAMELLISINAAPVGPATSAAFSDGLTVGDLGSAGPLLDERAKSEYKRRLTELREELAEAETLNDTGRAAHARGEIEMLTDQLSAAVGLGGRDRQAASHRERVRQMVTKRIKAILKNVAAADPALGHHLNTCISTGTFCMYDPPPASPDWTL
jgi:non-specific serine/threonine protein kinase